MQKVYLLLRNQEQSGPYSLNDLKSLELTESDLLWDTSKQDGWSYPFELGLPFSLSPTAEIKKKEIDPIIKKITEVPSKKTPGESAVDEDLSLDELSDRITRLKEKIKLVEQQLQVDAPDGPSKQAFIAKFKNRKKDRKPILIGVVTFIFLALVLIIFAFFTSSRQKIVANKPSAEIVTPVPKASPGLSGEKMQPAVTDSTYTISYEPVQDSATKVEMRRGKASIHPVIHRKMRKEEVLVKRTIVQEPPLKKELPAQASLDYVHKQTQLNFVNGDEKKKNVFKKLAGVFKKKDDVGNPGIHPGEDLIEAIDVSTSTTNYKWLKGVQGLTVALKNNSKRTIVRAQVDILFFNGENCIIERDTKFFTNVAPGKSQAIAVSDRPYAQHAGYQVISITATRN